MRPIWSEWRRKRELGSGGRKYSQGFARGIDVEGRRERELAGVGNMFRGQDLRWLVLKYVCLQVGKVW